MRPCFARLFSLVLACCGIWIPVTASAQGTGAVCILTPTGISCQELTQEQCAAHNGVFRGAGTTCATNPCTNFPSVGACCIQGPTGPTCVLLTQEQCTAQIGVFRGPGTTCNSTTCATG